VCSGVGKAEEERRKTKQGPLKAAKVNRQTIQCKRREQLEDGVRKSRLTRRELHERVEDERAGVLASN
jgi:hypothetical protein